MPTRSGVNCLLLLSAIVMGCKKRDTSMMNEGSQPQHFPTAEQAVAKAKADLLAVLRSGRDVNLGVDTSTLERAKPAKAVRRVELDFAKLLVADSTADLGSLVKEERNSVVPLVADDQVATIVEVNHTAEGWRVIGLAGKDIATDLNAVLKGAGGAGQVETTLYEVPNLQARVYGVRREGTESLYVDYRDRFTIGRAVTAAQLVPVLKADALEFEKQYGDSLKSQRLVR